MTNNQSWTREKLLEEFYENLENETFLGNAFTGEKEDLGEPDSSLDEDNDEESIANEEEIETNLQEADFETPETIAVDKEEVQKNLPRKQKFKNLDEVVNEKNYDELPQQKLFQKTMETKDKKFRIKYTTNKPVNQLNKTPSQNILKHAPGLRLDAKRARTPLEAFSLFINHEMLNTIVENTNTVIETFLVGKQDMINDSDRYSSYKKVDLTDIKAF